MGTPRLPLTLTAGLLDFFDHDQAERTFQADPSNPEHQGSLSHELISCVPTPPSSIPPFPLVLVRVLTDSGAAAFAAARAYENHQAQNGTPGSVRLLTLPITVYEGWS